MNRLELIWGVFKVVKVVVWVVFVHGWSKGVMVRSMKGLEGTMRWRGVGLQVLCRGKRGGCLLVKGDF
jgi:hypothetical protein